MLWNKLFKNPMLVIGVIMIGLVYVDFNSRGGTQFKRNFVVHYPCHKVMEALLTQTPANWKMTCNKNNLHLEIDESNKAELVNNSDKIFLVSFIYQDLAKELTYVAKNSPKTALLTTDIVSFRIHYPSITLNALTEGKLMHNLATLKDEKLIGDHLKSTVQVQEVWK